MDDHLDALPKPEPSTMATVRLPAGHSDALDRMLVAQAESEEVLPLTSDEVVTRYPGPTRRG